MNVRQAIEGLTGKNYFDSTITHQQKYEALIDALGREACISMLEPTSEELKEYYKIDEYFNNWRKYPLKFWDATGFYMIRRLGRKLNITSCSECEACCLAKAVARIKMKGELRKNT